MRKFIEAAFYPPSRTSEGFDSTRFAVLPQNTSDELTLSEVHSQLDRALTFLQRDVGYALLDDARPHTGGGVRLRPPERKVLAVPKGDRSAKLPKEESLLRSSPSRSDSPEVLADSSSVVLDDSIIVRLRTIFDRRDGELRPSELVEEIRRRQGQNLRAGVNGQLERLFRGIGIDDQDREITWQEFEALLADFSKAKGVSPEAVESVELVRQVLQEARSNSAPSSTASSQASSSSIPQALPDPLEEELPAIGPDIAKYAHYQCDLVLVSRFAHVLVKTVCQDLETQDGMSNAEARTRIESAVKHDGLYKCVLQGVRLMHLCDYDYADVVLVLAYASVYFRSTFASIGKKMSANEAAHVVVLLIYLAHAFLLDETCPLRIWQKHIFRKYCTLKVLDAALFRLFQMRPGFKLKIKYEEERTALLGLSGLQYQGYQARIPDDGVEEANSAANLMGVNLTHPKLSDKKDHPRADNRNGCEGELSSTASRANHRSNNHVKEVTSGGNSALGAPYSGSSSGSNGRTPASANSSAEAVVVAPIVVDHCSRLQTASTNSSNRLGEATNLLVSGRGRRDGRQRRQDHSKESTYSSARVDETVLPLAVPTDHQLSPAPTAAV